MDTVVHGRLDGVAKGDAGGARFRGRGGGAPDAFPGGGGGGGAFLCFGGGGGGAFLARDDLLVQGSGNSCDVLKHNRFITV